MFPKQNSFGKVKLLFHNKVLKYGGNLKKHFHTLFANFDRSSLGLHLGGSVALQSQRDNDAFLMKFVSFITQIHIMCYDVLRTFQMGIQVELQAMELSSLPQFVLRFSQLVLFKLQIIETVEDRSPLSLKTE